MSHYKPYPSYKDSGVEWLGEVPEGWEVIAAKRVFRQKREPKKAGSEQLAATQKYGVIPQKTYMEMEGNRLVLALTGTEGFKDVKKDEFVISLRSFEGGIERCFYDGCISPAYTVLSSSFDIDYGFFSYLMKSSIFIQELNTVITGIREGKTITYEQFSTLKLPIPKLSEQSNITASLDRETTRIDTLIAKKTRFIELLKEKRQAVITHAVTKGLDSNVKMKDSGVEWLGEVPEGWVVNRLRRVASFKNSNIDKKSRDDQEKVRLCNYTDVYYSEFIYDCLDFMKATASKDEIEQFRLQPFDVIITKDSEDPADIGIPTLVKETAADLVCGYHLTLIRSGNDIIQRFLHRLLQSSASKGYFYQECPGVTRYGLNQNTIGSIPVAMPTLEVADQICHFLDRETTRIDTLIDKTQNSIELLKERRSALITAAVTGKINVRGESERLEEA